MFDQQLADALTEIRAKDAEIARLTQQITELEAQLAAAHAEQICPKCGAKVPVNASK